MRDALSIFDQVTSFCEGNITYQKVIEDLNVLDYDEYFSMTDLLLKSDIPTAMVQLNNILSKGFEANYFMGGLASHFRNLLMCRDEQTLPLLDVSDQVKQRYHEQAKRCEPKLMYRALKLCNDCDMHYNAARNKRLLVELTLIEVAQAAGGEDDTSCGRGPIRRLKPLFQQQAAAIQAQAAANQPAQRTAPSAQAAPTANQTQATLKPTATTGGQPAQAAQGATLSTIDYLKQAASKTNAQRNTRTAQRFSIRQELANLRNVSTKAATPAAQAVVSPTTTATGSAQKLNMPFNEERLTHFWYRYAQNLPVEKRALTGRMKSMTPQVDTQTWVVTVKVENEMVEQYMRNEQIALMSYLRTQLRNDYITLQFEVAESDAPHRAFSRLEQFKAMLDSYSELDTLRKELDLELA